MSRPSRFILLLTPNDPPDVFADNRGPSSAYPPRFSCAHYLTNNNRSVSFNLCPSRRSARASPARLIAPFLSLEDRSCLSVRRYAWSPIFFETRLWSFLIFFVTRILRV